jgi:hypothetical protein
MSLPVAESSARRRSGKFRSCIGARHLHISPAYRRREQVMANKEQKRSTREAKKPKQKKKGAEKPAAGKPKS